MKLIDGLKQPKSLDTDFFEDQIMYEVRLVGMALKELGVVENLAAFLRKAGKIVFGTELYQQEIKTVKEVEGLITILHIGIYMLNNLDKAYLLDDLYKKRKLATLIS